MPTLPDVALAPQTRVPITAPQAEPEGRGRRWIARGLIAIGGLILLALANLLLLGLADYTVAGKRSADVGERIAWTIARGDHLHYAVHIIQGRLFDLCPWSRRAADAQYYYARFHAVTPVQRAVLKSSRPGGIGGLGEYVVGPVRVWLEWIGDGISWLRGNRPI